MIRGSTAKHRGKASLSEQAAIGRIHTVTCTYIMAVEHREDGGVVIGDHETRALESLGLMHQHVASLVVCIICYHHSS